jgi:hypothetical protein
LQSSWMSEWVVDYSFYYIQSTLETYSSNGIMLDAGITYKSEDGLNHYALVLRSMGFQFSTYYEEMTRQDTIRYSVWFF